MAIGRVALLVWWPMVPSTAVRHPEIANMVACRRHLRGLKCKADDPFCRRLNRAGLIVDHYIQCPAVQHQQVYVEPRQVDNSSFAIEKRRAQLGPRVAKTPINRLCFIEVTHGHPAK